MRAFYIATILVILWTLSMVVSRIHEVKEKSRVHDLGTEGPPKDLIVLSKDEANMFKKHRSKRFFTSGVYEECYSEGCSWEEVREAMGSGIRAREYYNQYLCSKRGEKSYCKVQCKYRRYCTFNDWSQWSGAKTPHGCSTQERHKSHMYSLQTTEQSGSCDGLNTDCPTPPHETRLICVCATAVCQLGQWSEWIGDMADGQCTVQVRTKPYTVLPKIETKLHSCKDANNNCEGSEIEFRTKCSCIKANCLLLEWTRWHTRNTSSRECSFQTRTRYYSKSYVFKEQNQNCGNVPKDCPRAISKSRTMCNCTYRNSCELKGWSTWSPNVTEVGCKNQTRTRAYVSPLIRTQQSQNCKGLNTTCIEEPANETRIVCNCTYRNSCELQGWSTWSPNVTEVGCKNQARTRAYVSPLHNTQQSQSCKGLNTTCIEEPKETGISCNCSYRNSCEVTKEWSEWSEVVTERGCKIQTRTRPYVSPLSYTQGQSCKGLNTTCIEEPKETRILCGCTYRKSCELMEWTEWSEVVKEYGCKNQTRTRAYLSPLKHIQDGNCTGLMTTCIEEPKETRTFCKCKRVQCQLMWDGWREVKTNGSYRKHQRIRSYSVKEVDSVFHVGDCNSTQAVCPLYKEVEREKSCDKVIKDNCKGIIIAISVPAALSIVVNFIILGRYCVMKKRISRIRNFTATQPRYAGHQDPQQGTSTRNDAHEGEDLLELNELLKNQNRDWTSLQGH